MARSVSQHPTLTAHLPFSSLSFILSPQISPAFNLETSGTFCQRGRAHVCHPDLVLVLSGRENSCCLYSLLFGPGFSLGHTRCSCGCAFVVVPTPPALKGFGEAEAVLTLTRVMLLERETGGRVAGSGEWRQSLWAQRQP